MNLLLSCNGRGPIFLLTRQQRVQFSSSQPLHAGASIHHKGMKQEEPDKRYLPEYCPNVDWDCKTLHVNEHHSGVHTFCTFGVVYFCIIPSPPNKLDIPGFFFVIVPYFIIHYFESSILFHAVEQMNNIPWLNWLEKCFVLQKMADLTSNFFEQRSVRLPKWHFTALFLCIMLRSRWLTDL